jgi:hypothetical protein
MMTLNRLGARRPGFSRDEFEKVRQEWTGLSDEFSWQKARDFILKIIA